MVAGVGRGWGQKGEENCEGPILQWLEDTENDLRDLKVKTWRQKKEKEREESAFAVKVAKVLRWLYSQGVSK
jgi:hypothetical protein